MSKEAMKLALEVLSSSWRTEEEKSALKEKQIQAIIALRGALADEALDKKAENARELGLDYELPVTMQAGELDCTHAERLCAELKLAEQPAQQEPVAFPARKAVEREIERTTSPTGMHLNDNKERVALPGGTLRHMLALIDRTTPPQRTWVGLTADDLKEPKNGEQWRVEWWNESCRMMLPADMKLDRSVVWKNGTVQFTIKKSAHGIKENT